jgi:hypothetical protein
VKNERRYASAGRLYFRSTGGCFSADTLVATENGNKPISEVEVGDRVLAYNETAEKVGAYRVSAVLVSQGTALAYLTLGGERIETTPEHPFYTREDGWLSAGELRVGVQVLRADGQYGTVEAIRVVEHRQSVYNLTVEEAHTYFVGGGRWLVHNFKRMKIWW